MDFDTKLKTGNRNDSPQQDTGRQKKWARNNLQLCSSDGGAGRGGLASGTHCSSKKSNV
jgi:hypothetical protein